MTGVQTCALPILPKEAQNYVEYLEKAVGCKITYISVGAEREAYIHHVV